MRRDAVPPVTGFPRGDALPSAGGEPEGDTAAEPLSLFAYPAESNYSGARLDPRLAAAVKAPGGAAAALEHLLRPPSAGLGGDGADGGGGGGAADGTANGMRGVKCPVAAANGTSPGEAAADEMQPLHRTPRWLVAVDAAKACGSSPPDLSDGSLDFLVERPAVLPALACLLPRLSAVWVLNNEASRVLNRSIT